MNSQFVPYLLKITIAVITDSAQSGTANPTEKKIP